MVGEQNVPLRVNRTLLIKASIGLAVVMGVAALTGIFLREPITAVAELFIDRFGWGGIFATVVFTDASPLPLTHEPVLLLAIATGLDPLSIAVVAASASVTAGPVGWLGGTLLKRSSDAHRWIERRAPGMTGFLKQWGATGVAIAALLPIPFSLATWTAGLTGVRFHKLMAASLLRIPKTLFYFWLIQQGWAMGA